LRVESTIGGFVFEEREIAVGFDVGERGGRGSDGSITVEIVVVAGFLGVVSGITVGVHGAGTTDTSCWIKGDGIEAIGGAKEADVAGAGGEGFSGFGGPTGPLLLF